MAGRLVLPLLLTLVALPLLALKPAPSFSLATTKTTNPIKLEDFKGKVLYLDFWASWCVPCRKSFPWMNIMQQRYADKGLVIVAINLDKQRKAVDKFLQSFPAQFIIALDAQGKSAAAYRVQGMPSSYLIDGQGFIRYTHLGFRDKTKDKMEARIKKLLLQK